VTLQPLLVTETVLRSVQTRHERIHNSAEEAQIGVPVCLFEGARCDTQHCVQYLGCYHWRALTTAAVVQSARQPSPQVRQPERSLAAVYGHSGEGAQQLHHALHPLVRGLPVGHTLQQSYR